MWDECTIIAQNSGVGTSDRTLRDIRSSVKIMRGITLVRILDKRYPSFQKESDQTNANLKSLTAFGQESNNRLLLQICVLNQRKIYHADEFSKSFL